MAAAWYPQGYLVRYRVYKYCTEGIRCYASDQIKFSNEDSAKDEMLYSLNKGNANRCNTYSKYMSIAQPNFTKLRHPSDSLSALMSNNFTERRSIHTRPYPDHVRVVEVGPRDGLQNECTNVSIDDRIALIVMLIRAGLTSIEVGSFVSAKWVPQMAGSGEVLAGVLERIRSEENLGNCDLKLPVLTPNIKGFELAAAAGAREVAIFAAASEAFCKRNINCSVEESLRRYKDVCDAAHATGTLVRGYISTVVGCPFEGNIDPNMVAKVSKALVDMGCYEVSLGDTVGVGTPLEVQKMLNQVMSYVPKEKLAVHFHDTYGMATANILVALQNGITVVDSALAGLGGCPYAPGAGGNVATEDVIYLLNGLEIETNVSIDKVMKASDFICNIVGKVNESRVGRALKSKATRNKEMQ